MRCQPGGALGEHTEPVGHPGQGGHNRTTPGEALKAPRYAQKRVLVILRAYARS